MTDKEKLIDMFEAGMLNDRGKDALIDALMYPEDEKQ